MKKLACALLFTILSACAGVPEEEPPTPSPDEKPMPLLPGERRLVPDPTAKFTAARPSGLPYCRDEPVTFIGYGWRHGEIVAIFGITNGRGRKDTLIKVLLLNRGDCQKLLQILKDYGYDYVVTDFVNRSWPKRPPYYHPLFTL